LAQLVYPNYKIINDLSLSHAKQALAIFYYNLLDAQLATQFPRSADYLRHKNLGFSEENSIYQVNQQAGKTWTSLSHISRKWLRFKKILLPDGVEGARIS
jgi:hypothetical protein